MAKRERPVAGSPVKNPGTTARPGGGDRPQTMSAGHPAAAAPRAALAPDAVSLFERGMTALQRHAYSDAAPHFQELVEHFPSESALRDRSQVYLDLCQRELTRKPAAPRTIEERLTAATAALNDDRDEDAEELARSVLAESPKHELALYLLAAIEARRGSMIGALQLLMQAVDVSPEIRAQARHDADFEDLHDLEAFQHLIEIPHQAPAASQGRPRRSRTER